MHVPTTALNLAVSLEKIGRLVEARDFALEAMRIPPTPNEVPAQGVARKEAEALAVTLTERIPVVDIKVDGPPPSSVEIFINGAISPGGLAVGRRLDPGPYVLEIRAAGHVTAKRSVVLVERERRGETFVLQPVGPSVPAGPPVTQAPITPRDGRASSSSRTAPIVLTVVGGVVGAAGIAVGTGTGVASLGQTSDLEDQCPGGRCPPSLADDLSDAETLANVSNVAFAVGAAGLVATTIGIVWLATGSSADDGSAAAIVVGPGFAGVRFTTP